MDVEWNIMFVMHLACADGVKLVKMKGQHGICYKTAHANEIKRADKGFLFSLDPEQPISSSKNCSGMLP